MYRSIWSAVLVLGTLVSIAGWQVAPMTAQAEQQVPTLEPIAAEPDLASEPVQQVYPGPADEDEEMLPTPAPVQEIPLEPIPAPMCPEPLADDGCDVPVCVCDEMRSVLKPQPLETLEEAVETAGNLKNCAMFLDANGGLTPEESAALDVLKKGLQSRKLASLKAIEASIKDE